MLSVYYTEGQIVKQDLNKAIEWLEKAAEQGQADAQYKLGLVYDLGGVVKQDREMAQELFRKACENGAEEACKEKK